MSEPWICPRCGKVNAPWMCQCTCEAIKLDIPKSPVIITTPYPPVTTTPYSPNICGDTYIGDPLPGQESKIMCSAFRN